MFDRNDSNRRFSTDRKLTSDFRQLQFSRKRLRNSHKRFTATLCRPVLFAIRELIESSIPD
ncbi:hypothetical protein BDI4_40012 [Burkholderia diffusa]|nr:hypothetical protein BDI4_40012 [Burkholderia diffusa]